MTDNHDPKCLAYGYGPGQRMDICICTGIRIGRADERERLVLTYGGSAAMAAVRADEQERHGNNCGGMWDEWLHDLRVKVEALPRASMADGRYLLWEEQVLALLDGADDE